MELTLSELDEYLLALATLLDRHGVNLDSDVLALDRTPSGAVGFELHGLLPAGSGEHASMLTVREHWAPTGDWLGRIEYGYEILDRRRDFRRAYHHHDADAFVRRYSVVVHEHCEKPIGKAPCAHVEGSPIRDGFAGVMRLIETWTDPEPPDCRAFRCLE